MTQIDGNAANLDVTTPRLFRVLQAIERFGNKLPSPFWLFWILAGVLSIASLILASLGVSVTLPSTGEVVHVKNLVSLDGVSYAISSALDNFSEFKPFVLVVVFLLGVSVAEKSGLFEALLRGTIIGLPGRWVTFSIAFGGMVAHVMGDSAIVIMMPLGAIAFRAVGRSPVLGVMVAYASASAGFNACPLVTSSEAVRAALTEQAARLVDPSYVVTPVAAYFFSAASSLLLAVVITVVVEVVLAKRADLDDDLPGKQPPLSQTESVRLSPQERRSLMAVAGVVVVFVGAVVAILAVPDSPLLGEGGSIVKSVVIKDIAVVLALLFGLCGYTFGKLTGAIPSLAALPKIMADGVSSVAPVIVLFFAVSQFLGYFEWTGIASVLTVHGADLLNAIAAPNLIVLLAVIISFSFLNMMITSGTAQWSILAPVVVPLMMYVGIKPEAALAAFMIGDSVTNTVTPMSAYFVLALGLIQQYRKEAGIGTLLSFTVPISAAMLVTWSAFFAAWYAIGIPLGPGVSIR